MKHLAAAVILAVAATGAQAQSTQFYGPTGAYLGSAQGNGATTNYYGATGAYLGNTQSNGGSTQIYGNTGSYLGSAQSQRPLPPVQPAPYPFNPWAR